MDDKSQYDHLPIPTYEEATSSRPGSSNSRLGPQEISDDAEREGLLGTRGSSQPTSTRRQYEPPTVESLRGSFDSLDGLEHEADDEVRREMHEMDMEEPDTNSAAHRSLLAYRLSKRFSSFTNSFPSLPSFRRYMPSFTWPRIDYQSLDTNKVVIIGRLFGIFLIVGVIYILIATDVLTLNRSRMNMSAAYDPESIRIFLQSHVNEHGNIQEYLKHITEFPHMAGTEGNFVLGEWIAELFKASELENVHMEQFDVYLNYPRKDGREASIIKPSVLRWTAALEEQHEDTLVFHGHSASGEATGALIYANYGSRADFTLLEGMGVTVKGSVVLMRYGGTESDRALKVKAAEDAGAVGCLIFSDPSVEGADGNAVYPEGRFMPKDGVQRGAVSLMSRVVGDVLSPGWASTPEEKKRLKVQDSSGLVKIPSLPLSWKDASYLLACLHSHGQRMYQEDWKGVHDFQYWSGDGHHPILHMRNIQDEEVRQPIYNVLGRITGWEQPEKKIIVGNHRDAWCKGAADPGSGTAIMLEVMRLFGELRRLGWRPLRTIEFASWDGEEYNLIGSTEHVEKRMDDYRRNGWAYVNIDTGVSGPDFHVAASPALEPVLMHAIDRVTHPDTGESVKTVWEKAGLGIEGLGAGSDYVAFQDLAGVSSMDVTFKGQPYPYHSCYDNFEWMEKFGDPGFKYHETMGQIMALMILDLSDRPLLSMDVVGYSRAISDYVDKAEGYANDAIAKHKQSFQLNFQPLRTALDKLHEEAEAIRVFEDIWTSSIYGGAGFETSTLALQRMDHNSRLANFESNLLDLAEGGGLVNRTQFKHVVFGPQLWSGYDEAYFPGIRDAVDIQDWDMVNRQIEKIAEIVGHAAQKLNGN